MPVFSPILPGDTLLPGSVLLPGMSSAAHPPAFGYTPTVEDIADLMPARARTGGASGHSLTQAGVTFADPARVLAAIVKSASIVAAKLGGDTLPEKFYDAAKELIILRVALRLEPGLWPEQAQPDKSAWDQWKLLYDEGLKDLFETIRADAADGDTGDGGPEDTGALSPLYGFPPAVVHGHQPGVDVGSFGWPGYPLSGRTRDW